MDNMTLKQKLAQIQSEIRVNKDLVNDFGGFKYRNAEKIEEVAKPICAKYNTLLVCGSIDPIKEPSITQVGDRYYINEYAHLFDLDSDEVICVVRSAREQEQKKGMDAAQITGASSSYAIKYALGGLFLLDDSKDDPDAKDNSNEKPVEYATPIQIQNILENKDLLIDKFKELGIKNASDVKKLTSEQASKLCGFILEAKANG